MTEQQQFAMHNECGASVTPAVLGSSRVFLEKKKLSVENSYMIS